MLRKIWRIWAKAIGEKAGATDRDADRIALVRTSIVLTYILTNIVIVAGVVRHWNDGKPPTRSDTPSPQARQ